MRLIITCYLVVCVKVSELVVDRLWKWAYPLPLEERQLAKGGYAHVRHQAPVRFTRTKPWRQIKKKEALLADCTEQYAPGVEAALVNASIVRCWSSFR